MDYASLIVGDRIAEYDLGLMIESAVIEPPTKIIEGEYIQWEWKTKTDDGTIIEYLRTVGYEHYCGRLKKQN
jgi:hypothetical protein